MYIIQEGKKLIKKIKKISVQERLKAERHSKRRGRTSDRLVELQDPGLGLAPGFQQYHSPREGSRFFIVPEVLEEKVNFSTETHTS